MGTGTRWTKKEIDALKKHYPNIGLLSKKLSRSTKAIISKAVRSGLTTKDIPQHKGGHPRKVLLLSPKEPDPSVDNEVNPKKSAALRRARIFEVSARIRETENYLLSAPSDTKEWSENMMNYHALIAKHEQMIKNQ